MKELTKQQQAVLDYLKERENLYSHTTLQDIINKFRFNSKTSAKYFLDALERKKYIQRIGNGVIKITGGNHDSGNENLVDPAPGGNENERERKDS